MLTYHHGNYLGNLHFIWRIHSEGHTCTDTVRVVDSIKPEIPKFHTRQMLKDASVAFGNMMATSPSTVRTLYEHFTGSPSNWNHDV